MLTSNKSFCVIFLWDQNIIVSHITVPSAYQSPNETTNAVNMWFISGVTNLWLRLKVYKGMQVTVITLLLHFYYVVLHYNFHLAMCF